MIDKISSDILSSIGMISDGDQVAIGGFGECGSPCSLIDAVCELDLKNLHIISNNGGTVSTSGVGRLLAERRVRKFSCSFPVNPVFLQQYLAGEVELELVPQGTLAERLRAGGAGIGAFYTPTGAGTLLGNGGFPMTLGGSGDPKTLMEPKERRVIDGVAYVLEFPLRPDAALVHASWADRFGNLRFRYGAENFNLVAGMAARYTLAEAEHVSAEECIPAQDVHLPGIFVSSVVRGAAATVLSAEV